MSDLSKKSCVPCKSGAAPIQGEELQRHMDLIEEGWKLNQENHIERLFTFKDFKGALGFVNEVGKTAEEEGHHPDIELSWGKVKLILWTHKIGGLTESDFIMAAKCDTIYTSRVH